MKNFFKKNNFFRSSDSLVAFTQLDKLINNILTVKVGRATKKLLYLKQKKSSIFLKGSPS